MVWPRPDWPVCREGRARLGTVWDVWRIGEDGYGEEGLIGQEGWGKERKGLSDWQERNWVGQACLLGSE